MPTKLQVGLLANLDILSKLYWTQYQNKFNLEMHFIVRYHLNKQVVTCSINIDFYVSSI